MKQLKFGGTLRKKRKMPKRLNFWIYWKMTMKMTELNFYYGAKEII